jgi:hypothetical protein
MNSDDNPATKLQLIDVVAMNSMHLKPPRPWLDSSYSEHAAAAAVHIMANGKSTRDSTCPAEYCKAPLEDLVLLLFLCEMMNEYWESGSFPQGDIAIGPPLNLAAPTTKLAVKNGWRISF